MAGPENLKKWFCTAYFGWPAVQNKLILRNWKHIIWHISHFDMQKNIKLTFSIMGKLCHSLLEIILSIKPLGHIYDLYPYPDMFKHSSAVMTSQ